MNNLQRFFAKKILGIEQPGPGTNTPKKPAYVPFTPYAAAGLRQPPAYDLQAQQAQYSSWCYACVNKIVTYFTSVELELYRSYPQGDNKQIFDHPALDLIYSMGSTLTKTDLMEFFALQMQLAGEHYWWKIKDASGKITQIYPFFNPAFMEVVPSSDNFIEGFVYTIPGTNEVIPFAADEMIQFKYLNPVNPYRGISPVKAAEIAIATDREAKGWNWRFFKNEAKPYGGIKVEGTLTDEQYERLRKQWDAGHQGTENAHRLAILEGGADYVDIGFSQKDMDFMQQRKMDRDEIFAIFGVPIGLVFPENSNRAMAETSKMVFIDNTITPLVKKFLAYVNEFLVSEFGDDLILDFVDPSPANLEIRGQYYQSAIQGGWMTPNEARKEDGLQPIPGGDQLFMPLNYIPIGEADPAAKKHDFNYKRPRLSMKEKIYIETKKAIRQKGAKLKKQNAEAEKKDDPKDSPVIYSRRFKDLYAKAIIMKMDREESLFRKTLRKEFKRQEEAVLKTLDVIKAVKTDATVVFEADVESRAFFKVFEPIVMEIVKEHGIDAMRFLGLEDFESASDRIVRYMKGRGMKFAKDINEVTAKKIKQALIDGTAASEGPREIARRIKQVFTEASTSRTFNIARSETARATNFGIVEAWKQSEIVIGKEWVTAKDDRVCPYCSSMEDESRRVIELNENYFNLGDTFDPDGADRPLKLDYEPIYSPPLHSQCRCVLIPRLARKHFNPNARLEYLVNKIDENKK